MDVKILRTVLRGEIRKGPADTAPYYSMWIRRECFMKRSFPEDM